MPIPPVTWRPPRAVRHPALAVPCNQCGAEIGRHCTAHYAQGDARDPHRMRREIAEAHGFRWSPGAAPPSEAAYLADLRGRPEPEPDAQPALL